MNRNGLESPLRWHLLGAGCLLAALVAASSLSNKTSIAGDERPATRISSELSTQPNHSARVQVAAADTKPAAKNSASKKPNIVVIFGDDIGQSNISAYTLGLMGYRTPNIDRLAREGMIFTDYYAEQSCTAGRSSFITGQCTLRTGLSKVGIPAATVGLQSKDATIAELLKAQGYATAQFGKNHLGDRNEYLPTVHGFDEFYGNLYHLNAEEEPELPDYPKSPEFKEKYGPRGVLDCKSSEVDDPTVDPRWGRVGKQVIKDTGPLNRERMVIIDDDIAARSVDYLERKSKENAPFFMWVNFTHMHLRTHTKPESIGQAGHWQSPYHDTMIDHDKNVGTVLDKLNELKIADDTIVIYTTDNGPHMNTWPDGAMTPFRSEKDTGWEGAFRVPCMIRWPDKIKAGSVNNEIVSGLDWAPTLLAAAGDPDITAKLLKGHIANGKTFKNHLDGYNQLPFLTGTEDHSARKDFFYFSDDGDLLALRFDNWKLHFAQQRSPGTLALWGEPFVHTRIPWLYNLKTDPYEKATITSNTYWDWYMDHVFLIYPAADHVGKFLESFREFPAAQTPATFTIDQVMQMLKTPVSK